MHHTHPSSFLQFLSNLLSKFKNDSNEACTGSAFAKQVAESLSQCVQSNDEFLESECPICLEEPRIEDSVHSKYLRSSVSLATVMLF